MNDENTLAVLVGMLDNTVPLAFFIVSVRVSFTAMPKLRLSCLVPWSGGVGVGLVVVLSLFTTTAVSVIVTVKVFVVPVTVPLWV